jgi:phenylpyruvate tautomerase PptA (4-oxalocrotonate tautomerase family)
MPLVEIIHASDQPASREQKRALMQEFTDIFAEVLGTPNNRLLMFFNALDLEDSNASLLAGDRDQDLKNA